MEIEEARQHAGRLLFSACIYGEIYERAIEALPHTMWTWGDEKHREGWCSACRQPVDLRPKRLRPQWAGCDPYIEPDGSEEAPFLPILPCNMTRTQFENRYTGRSMHLDTGLCPSCGAAVRFRSLAKGHKTLMDRLFLVIWQKSAIEPETALVCVGYELTVAWKDMDDERPDVPLDIEPREICVIRCGEKGNRFIRGWNWNGNEWLPGWKSRLECKSGYCPGMSLGNPGTQVVLDQESLWEAVQGMPMERVLQNEPVQNTLAWDCYDRISLLERLARYPSIEYLYKLGMDGLAKAAIDKTEHGLMNLRGSTARQVLRLSADEWAEVKGKKLPITLETLRVHRLARRKKLRMNMELCHWLGRQRSGGDDLQKLLMDWPEVSAVKAVKYCRKQQARLGDYVDYLADMRELGMDPHDREFAWPRDFGKAHTELSARVVHVRTHDKDEQICGRVQSGELDGYFFSALGLTMRPMLSGGEVIAEGTLQHHCVGRYVNTYAEGNDVLCVLREDSAPENPLYTVEFAKDGHLVQCRGDSNDMTPEGRERKREDQPKLDLFFRLHNLMREDLKEMKKQKKGANAA